MNNIKRTITIILIVFITILNSFGQDKQKESVVVEELVAIVGDSPIMLSDVNDLAARIIDNRKKQGVNTIQNPQEEALEMLMSNKLYAQFALQDSLEKLVQVDQVLTIVEQQQQQMIEMAGSVKNLERLHGKAIFQIKKDIERDVRESELSRLMQQKIKEDVVTTHIDVEDFFNKIPTDSLPVMPPQFSYSQIVKIPEATKERKFKIREQLLGFRERVLNGEKLGVLAYMYSEDTGSKQKMGEMGPIPIQNLVGPFAEALSNLEIGVVSEIVETEFGMHLIELISKDGDIVHFRHLLMKPSFTVDETEKIITELDSLKTAIVTGVTTFNKAALRHSNDKITSQNGGRVMNLTMYRQTMDMANVSATFPLDEMTPIDYRNISKLKIDSISSPFATMDEKGNIVYKLVKLDKKMEAHTANIKDDYVMIHSIAKLNKEQISLEKWIDDKISSMYVYISPSYRDYNFSRKEWVYSSEKSENSELKKRTPSLENQVILAPTI